MHRNQWCGLAAALHVPTLQVQSNSAASTFIQFEAPQAGHTFSASPQRLTLPPLGSQQVRLTFSPQHAGQHYFKMSCLVKVHFLPLITALEARVCDEEPLHANRSWQVRLPDNLAAACQPAWLQDEMLVKAYSLTSTPTPSGHEKPVHDYITPPYRAVQFLGHPQLAPRDLKDSA